MIISFEKLSAIAEETGFREEVIEKALHLLNLLNTLNSHPILKGKWILKGGTALNLFEMDMPRLSVDIDLNYIGDLNSEEMLANRPKVEKAIQAVFSREGFTIKRVPTEHAGGKWRLKYQTSSGQSGNLEVDFNFMFRLPLWDLRHADSHSLGDFQAENIPILDLHELAAGKLSALMSRGQARDLYDSIKIFRLDNLDYNRLRLGFVVYGAMNRKDWRKVSIDDINFDPIDLKRQLFPMLRMDGVEFQADPEEYGAHLVEECRKDLSFVLPFTESERKFLDLLLDKGEIDATILTTNPALQQRIQKQPLLEWKALNVKRHKGLS
ncbi:MAG: nucleotidyl transferase AbiEii/AbiGii toxin family protein [Candidatus Aminicenantaceae bacterium]